VLLFDIVEEVWGRSRMEREVVVRDEGATKRMVVVVVVVVQAVDQ
jgi:hypothetical protein